MFPERSMRPSIPHSSAGCSPTALLINCLLLLLLLLWERRAPGVPGLPAPSPACKLTAPAPCGDWRPRGSWHPPRTHA